MGAVASSYSHLVSQVCQSTAEKSLSVAGLILLFRPAILFPVSDYWVIMSDDPLDLLDEDRAALARALYLRAYEATESFRHKTIGACIAYLLGHILVGDSVGYCAPLDDEELDEAAFLVDLLPRDDHIWQYIEVSMNGGDFVAGTYAYDTLRKELNDNRNS